MTIKRDSKGKFAKGTNTETQFKKENIPWNKGLKGFHRSPETEFHKDEYVGSEHPSWKGGIQHTKDGIFVWVGNTKRMKRARKVYIETYGEIPKGYVIYHKNGDSFDDRPSNLEAISRAELMKRNSKN